MPVASASSASASSRPIRKRNLLLEMDDDRMDQEPPLRRARRDVLSTEVETLQAELEHARSLRALDAKRFHQVQQRLERQVDFAVEESKEAKAMMDELRDETDRHLDQMRQARINVQEELREVQLQLEEEQAVGATAALEEDPKIERLEVELDAKSVENAGLLEIIDNLREELRNRGASEEATSSTSRNVSLAAKDSSSPAKPAVMKEMNRVRLQLQDSERKNRQFQRFVDELQKKAKQLVHEREAARSATARVQQLESDMKDSNRAREAAQAQCTSWKEFGINLGKLLGKENSLSNDPNVPPEVAVVKRYLSEATKRAADSLAENCVLKKQVEQLETSNQTLESTVREMERKETAWNKEQQHLEKKIQSSETQVNVLKGQEGIWKREVESLRSIVQTFDKLPLGGGKKTADSVTSSSSSDAKVRMMQASIDASQEQIQVLQIGQVAMNKDFDAAISEKAELQKTHNNVLEKFGKLRDAVYAERAKAEKAEARAVHAEELAGKGSFNPETTRVVHLQQNPLLEALKQENSVLRRENQVLKKGDQKKTAKVLAADVDPNKLHQRLKESFKEQIGRFREGVYLLTGYKVDMIPDDRPRFKVRSMFAERETDHLMFQWPEGKDVRSLDLLDTEMAKFLTQDQSYEYVTRFHSLPAFLASVQLGLFEKQTMVT